MLIRKCDRCGAVYGDECYPNVATACIFGRMHRCSNVNFDYDSSKDIWQLCPKCISEIQSYLKDASLSIC